MILVILYVVLAPIVFFGTLGSAHRAMRNSKQQTRNEVSERLLLEYRKARSVLERGTPGDSIATISQLNELYRLTSQFTVWPFNFDTIRGFSAAISAPLVAIAIPISLELLRQ